MVSIPARPPPERAIAVIVLIVAVSLSSLIIDAAPTRTAVPTRTPTLTKSATRTRTVTIIRTPSPTPRPAILRQTGINSTGLLGATGNRDAFWSYRVLQPDTSAFNTFIPATILSASSMPSNWYRPNNFTAYAIPADNYWNCVGGLVWEMQTTVDFTAPGANVTSGVTFGVSIDDNILSVTATAPSGASADLTGRSQYEGIPQYSNNFDKLYYYDLNAAVFPALATEKTVTLTISGKNAGTWTNPCGMLLFVGPRPTPSPPLNVAVKADERVATVSWTMVKFEGGNAGFAVTYGPVSGAGPNSTVYTPEEIVQIQPLTPGVQYFVIVQQISSSNVFGAPSPAILTQSDSTRVDALRATMTGFFDDFNRPAGPFDERKWNTGYAITGCPDPQRSGAFINHQFHAHSFIGVLNLQCGRTFVINRPRAIFDFTGIVGKVVTDFDFGPNGHEWMIKLIDASQGRADTFQDGRNELTIKQDGRDTLTATYMSTFNNGTSAMLQMQSKVNFVKNVRRNFVITYDTIGKTLTVNIDGNDVLQAVSVNFVFTRAHVLFIQDLYNPGGTNQDQAITAHWDNFGFNGAPPTYVTNNYPITLDADSIDLPVGNTTLSVVIPDSLAGATSALLHFSGYLWNGDWNSFVYINDNQTGIRWYDVRINVPEYSLPIPLSQLKGNGAANTFVFQSTTPQKIYNVHVEVDFPAASPPPYTPPTPWYGNLTGPVYNPMAGIYMPGYDVEVWEVSVYGRYGLSDGDLDSAAGGAVPSTGIVRIRAYIHPYLQILSFGKGTPLARIELQLDQSPIKTWAFSTPYAVTEFDLDFFLDLSTLDPGTHELFVIAYDKDDTPSIPQRGSSSEPRPWANGFYLPRKINVGAASNKRRERPEGTPGPRKTW